ncbi:hypothetical protein [Stenotrophomonas maltophilia]|uniref:Uncharacterized protein n=1 Tax=Stenotrophomonas maltophilia TaxID=40324 RepID=A0AAJ2JC54_STEMA|nr:hypothetical protein [Stenotrophomonas maltophilia]MDT3468634.1 hypothetical protein [Stenotrophomonas maltophilia]
MAAEAKTNAGSKLYICVIPQNEDLSVTEFAALIFVQVKKVGSIGERGINTNAVQYDTLDTLVAQKGKGITNAGDPQIEGAEDLIDPGQVAMRPAGAPTCPTATPSKLNVPPARWSTCAAWSPALTCRVAAMRTSSSVPTPSA